MVDNRAYLALQPEFRYVQSSKGYFKKWEEKKKKGILICLVISLIITLYELYWFLFKGSELGLVIAVLSFVVSYICFYLWSKK